MQSYEADVVKKKKKKKKNGGWGSPGKYSSTNFGLT